MTEFLKYDDVLKLSQLLTENGFDKYNLLITTMVDKQDTLNKIDEDYYYRLAESDEPYKPKNNDELEINVGSFKYKYIINDSK